MEFNKIIEFLGYIVPAILVLLTAYFLLQAFFKEEEKKRHFSQFRANRKQALPLKLQAYERMVLFLERIHPAQLLLRVQPTLENKNDYVTLLSHAIQTEFEYNLPQQIYISIEGWEMIVKAKNSTLQLLRATALEESITSTEELRENILLKLTQTEVPSYVAILYLKQELKTIF